MPSPSRRLAPLLTLTLVALATAGLWGCDKNDSRSAGQKVDAGIAKVESQAAEIKADASRASAEAKQAANDAVQDAKQAAGKATVKVGGAISDTAIKASVKAKLALDSSVEASRIEVDAAQGRVSLRGSADNAEAVARAGQIAQSIDGVVGVDNQVIVKAKS